MAIQKFLITFLALTVLVQLSIAEPDDDSKSTESAEENIDFEKFAILELDIVIADFAPKEVHVLREVKKELNAIENRTEADNEALDQVEELIVRNDVCTTIAIMWLYDMMSVLDIYRKPHLPGKKPKLHNILENHGWRKIRDELEIALEPKVDELALKVKQHYDRISDSEKTKTKNLAIEKIGDKKINIGERMNLLVQLVTNSDDLDDEAK